MKKVFLLMAVVAMSFAACAQGQKKMGEMMNGPRMGGGMMMNSKAAIEREQSQAGLCSVEREQARPKVKEGDSVFVALKNETLGKFKQLTFEDLETGKTMEYNLLVPEGYDGTRSYPLVLFMADASTVNKGVTTPLTQGYGALEFASDRDQQKHPSFVLVPQFTGWAVKDDWSTSDEVEMTIRLLQSVMKQYKVDAKRVYTTGQSMGGMMSFYFNIAHPDLFAASLFVSCQWDTTKMKDFGRKRFFYIVAGGDEKASGGMSGLSEVLTEQNVKIDSASWNAKLPAAEQERLTEKLIAKGNSINFIKFEKGTVLPESSKGMEHMASFDYGYKIAAVRDWLFEQSRE